MLEDPQPTPTENRSVAASATQNDFWRFSAELIKTALIVSVLAYVIRVFVLQPFIVDGASMAPTFHTNDYLMVDKLSYRLHPAARGDIVVFKYPLDTSPNPVNYVKRIIGLPGERVRIEDGKVYIVNKDNPDGFLLDEPYINADALTTLQSGAAKAEFVVEENQYFVMGDNRPASSDSRQWGVLPKKDMIGRVVLQAFPLDRVHVIEHARYDQ